MEHFDIVEGMRDAWGKFHNFGLLKWPAIYYLMVILSVAVPAFLGGFISGFLHSSTGSDYAMPLFLGAIALIMLLVLVSTAIFFRGFYGRLLEAHGMPNAKPSIIDTALCIVKMLLANFFAWYDLWLRILAFAGIIATIIFFFLAFSKISELSSLSSADFGSKLDAMKLIIGEILLWLVFAAGWAVAVFIHAVRTRFSIPLLVRGDANWWDAPSKSYSAVKGRTFEVFIIIFAASLLVSFAFAPVSSLFGTISNIVEAIDVSPGAASAANLAVLLVLLAVSVPIAAFDGLYFISTFGHFVPMAGEKETAGQGARKAAAASQKTNNFDLIEGLKLSYRHYRDGDMLLWQSGVAISIIFAAVIGLAIAMTVVYWAVLWGISSGAVLAAQTFGGANATILVILSYGLGGLAFIITLLPLLSYFHRKVLARSMAIVGAPIFKLPGTLGMMKLLIRRSFADIFCWYDKRLLAPAGILICIAVILSIFAAVLGVGKAGMFFIYLLQPALVCWVLASSIHSARTMYAPFFFMKGETAAPSIRKSYDFVHGKTFEMLAPSYCGPRIVEEATSVISIALMLPIALLIFPTMGNISTLCLATFCGFGILVIAMMALSLVLAPSFTSIFYAGMYRHYFEPNAKPPEAPEKAMPQKTETPPPIRAAEPMPPTHARDDLPAGKKPAPPKRKITLKEIQPKSRQAKK